MSYRNQLIKVGYDLDAWHNYGERKEINADISQNSHMLICGMSGSGKSYFQQILFARLAKIEAQGIFLFADYKNEFEHLQGLDSYYGYKDALKGIEIAHEILQNRIDGVDKSRTQVTLIFDEYVSCMLNLLGEDKKKAQLYMNMVSELLMLGRSLRLRLVICCQRPDANVFSYGSRNNFGILIVLGAYFNSTYEMLMPEYRDIIKSKEFGLGEGSILFQQSSKLQFLKVPKIENQKLVQGLCIRALSKP